MSEKIPGDRFFEFAVGNSHPPLTQDQKEVLDFGKRWFPTIGHRENAIQEQFGYPSHVYFQKLNALRHHPEASEYAPDVITRVNRALGAPTPKRGAYGTNRMSDGRQ